jgi:hypothetical protein
MEGRGVVEAFSSALDTNAYRKLPYPKPKRNLFNLHQKLLPVAEFIDPDFIPQSWIYEFG